MPITPNSVIDSEVMLVFAKIAILIILAFYVIFALIIIRQVDLMGKTLITSLSPIVKAIAIINTGFAIGLILLAWGML